MFMVILFLLILVLFILAFFLFGIDKFLKKKLTKKFFYKPENKELELNPDINTLNWDLHKFRLNKFKRSQYKGLTFFVSSENRIYYLSEEGDKVYC
ncbi:MAG: cytochrome B [Prochlorococcus marinus CUG1436]|nr:cytochrome B [Prochlorococcus marinus CUG1436]